MKAFLDNELNRRGLTLPKKFEESAKDLNATIDALLLVDEIEIWTNMQNVCKTA